MSVPIESKPSPAFIEKLRVASAPHDGVLTFEAFMDLALYGHEIGYYRKSQSRVGTKPGTDFFTATSVGSFFGELICAAVAKLAGPEKLSGLHFVEVGAEPTGGILNGISHPFASTRTIGIGETVSISGPSVVFSNELFDAQPFRRFVFRQGGWREIGVELRGDALHEIELPSVASTLPLGSLPVSASEGYRMDAPIRSVELLDHIAAQPWSGWFIAFDYGKTWSDLALNFPAGTARAYFRHQQSNDLLARPGEQDLTCHVCWDWLMDALQKTGFQNPQLEWQESFFVHHAGDFIEKTLAAEMSRMSRKKMALLQLLHPTQLGQKFQVLYASR